MLIVQCHLSTVRCSYITLSVFSKIISKDTHRSPVMVCYGCLFWVWTINSAAATAVLSVISCYIEPGYNDTQLCEAWRTKYIPTAKKMYLLYLPHYCDAMMGAVASQITSLTIVYSTVYSGADQNNPQSSASLAFVLGIHRGPVYSPHKWPVTRKMFPFDDVIMKMLTSSTTMSCAFLLVTF